MYLEFIIIYILLIISIAVSVVSLIINLKKGSNNSKNDFDVTTAMNYPINPGTADHPINAASSDFSHNANNRDNVGIVFCTKCGNSYPANESVCPKCGQHRG